MGRIIRSVFVLFVFFIILLPSVSYAFLWFDNKDEIIDQIREKLNISKYEVSDKEFSDYLDSDDKMAFIESILKSIDYGEKTELYIKGINLYEMPDAEKELIKIVATEYILGLFDVYQIKYISSFATFYGLLNTIMEAKETYYKFVDVLKAYDERFIISEYIFYRNTMNAGEAFNKLYFDYKPSIDKIINLTKSIFEDRYVTEQDKINYLNCLELRLQGWNLAYKVEYKNQIKSHILSYIHPDPPSNPPNEVKTNKVYGILHENSATGRPLPDADVTCAGYYAKTQSDGSFSFSSIPVGKQTLSFSKVGYQSFSLNIAVLANDPYNAGDRWLVANNYLVTGGIYGVLHKDSASGPGLSGASVTCGGKSTTTRSDGSFSLSGIPTGDQIVTFSKSGYVTYERAAFITAGANTSLGDRWLVLDIPTPPASGPDLAIHELTINKPDQDDKHTLHLAPGEKFTINVWVKNRGNAKATKEFIIRYLISDDSTINQADQVIGTDKVKKDIGVNKTYSDHKQKLSAPSTPGIYYIGAWVDSPEDMNKSNNFSRGDDERGKIIVEISNKGPEGWLDSVGCDTISGWARDPDSTAPIKVHFYSDGPAGTGTFIGEVTADRFRSDLPFTDQNHGFTFGTPFRLKDGLNHNIYVYAIDSGGGQNPLLNGSPKLLVCAEPTVLQSILLPKTGQIISYVPGDDGDVKAGVDWPDPRFQDNGDNTVTDSLTGLVWTKTAGLDQNTWQEALDYVKGMNAGEYENFGNTDWRLPNVLELESLLDASQTSPYYLPVGNPFIFPYPIYYSTYSPSFYLGYFHYNEYWSSTTSYAGTNAVAGPGLHNFAYSLSWSGSLDSRREKTGKCIIWPVRTGVSGAIKLPKTGQVACYDSQNNTIDCSDTGQDGEIRAGVSWPETRFFDYTGTGTIVDALTGLMWTQNANPPGGTNLNPPEVTLTWEEALNYIDGMNAGIYENFGYTDWRLPNRKELLSLISFEDVIPSLPIDHPFFNIGKGGYHSSTTNAKNSSSTWRIAVNIDPDDAFGVFYEQDKSFRAYVWPVRGGLSSQ